MALYQFYGCIGCGRVGTSVNDLMRQGCEGRPEPLLPVSEVKETIKEELDILREQLRRDLEDLL